MPFYMQRFKFAPNSMKALVDKPNDRRDSAKRMVEAHGGKLRDYFLAFGEYDVLLIAEYPDNAAATAVSMTVGASAAFSGGETTPLITMEEAVAAMKRANKAKGAYKPPTAGSKTKKR
jgi:uncharacterized protein with GYD domain